MRIALVTIHYRNLADTLGLLKSLSQCILPPGVVVSIYVVDNEGSSELAAKIKKHPNSVLVASGANLGFAAGNNLGLKRAITDGNDILVTINNDTFVEKSFISSIASSPIKDTTVGAVGGLIYFAPGYEFHQNYSRKDLGKVVWSAGGNFDWGNILGSNTAVDEVDRGQFKQIAPTDFITGALLITKSEVLKKVGFFDEKYFMYLEDVDLSHRIKLAGFRLVVDPSIKLWHKVAQSSGIGSPLNDYFITRNRLYFGLKYASLRTKFALFREALRFLISGRPAQKIAVTDFFTGKLGSGTYIN